MLTDYYEHVVQKSRQQELIERARQDRLAQIVKQPRTRKSLLATFHRLACRLRLPIGRTTWCAVYSPS